MLIARAVLAFTLFINSAALTAPLLMAQSPSAVAQADGERAALTAMVEKGIAKHASGASYWTWWYYTLLIGGLISSAVTTVILPFSPSGKWKIRKDIAAFLLSLCTTIAATLLTSDIVKMKEKWVAHRDAHTAYLGLALDMTNPRYPGDSIRSRAHAIAAKFDITWPEPSNYPPPPAKDTNTQDTTTQPAKDTTTK